MNRTITVNLRTAFREQEARPVRNAGLLIRYVVFMAVTVLTCCAAAEDGWPFVRGAGFDGHSSETGLVNDWPDDGPPVLWVRRLGQGYSAFVATGDRVFTQSQNMTGQYLYCLEADTGMTIWEYRYDWPYESAGVYPGPRSTPTLSGDKVFFTSPDGLLACLKQDDGSLVWSVDLQDVYGIEGCDFGYSCSPTVTDGLVILPVGGSGAGVVAFETESGKEVWRSTSQPASYTPAYPIELNGEQLVVCYMQNALLILNCSDGQVRREISLSRGYDEHSAWPIYREPYLWLSGPFQAGSYVLDLTRLDAEDADLPVVWRSDVLSNDVCSSVRIGDQIYGFDIFDVQSKTHRPSRGIFRCIDFDTGNVRWSVGTGRPRRSSNADEFANDIGQCGIIVAEDRLIVLNELGELILLKADSDVCTELDRCTVLGGELTWTPPCLHRGRLYVRNQSQAVCVYLGDPANLKDVQIVRAGELPQQQYYNLAATLLAVEPEYAFDIPHNRWLIQWFLAGAGLLVLGRLVVALAGRRLSESGLAFAELAVLVVLGAVSTTILGHLTAEFVFTWPVCLYAALEYVAKPLQVADTISPQARFVRQRFPLFVFVAVSIAYFFLCRRLSLVFEWAFLIGYAGGLPVVWLTRRVNGTTRKHVLLRLLISLLGFGCFYGAAVIFLKSRY